MKVNKNLQPVSIPIEPHNRHIEMTPKEALSNLVTLMRDEYNFPFNLTTEYKVLKQALTELEELKRDVKRFMELKNNITNREEMDEFWEIDNKLSKVGNEE